MFNVGCEVQNYVSWYFKIQDLNEDEWSGTDNKVMMSRYLDKSL